MADGVRDRPRLAISLPHKKGVPQREMKAISWASPFQLKHSSCARHEGREIESRKKPCNIFASARRCQNVAVRPYEGRLEALSAEPVLKTGGLSPMQHFRAGGRDHGA